MPVADAGDTTIRYTVTGAGPVVMLIAGTGYSGSTWHPEFLELLSARATVVTFDHRGTGDSPGTGNDYQTRQFAADAHAVLQAAGTGPAHLVGHSMGGRVAQWLAFDHPDSVTSLVFAASGPGPACAPYSRVGVPIPMTLDLMEHGYDRAFYRRAQLRSFFTPEFAAERPAEVDWLTDACWNSAPSLVDYLKHVRARQAHAGADIVRTLAHPALVMVGSRDTHPGGTGSHIDEAGELMRLLPHGRLEVIDGLRHGLFWERPQTIAELITDWIMLS